ncbi:hypothetical protein D9757_004527 [Collybiopsis confluens]|uniref:Prolyl 4-hydroxylase alpha subunit Fe(2+) 2OG dioxygenase domain-containing protein n=1 Tax=Collybiopsis confluens TaxID=2823264 RepID=A0A8H5HWZ0_9AGAR|nr:hypothetical protein D9757_004527 [Collybiopsis confluens]
MSHSMDANPPTVEHPAAPAKAERHEEEKEEEEEEDEDDMESELSDGGDFAASSFAFGTTCPQAPNPVLTIEGIGQIGLPLSERDANIIIQHANQAPFGHNHETVIDTSVRDTFEIDASRVRFSNPLFNAWLLSELLCTITTKLGTQAKDTSIELYKLLLYRTGSHFKKHQDTAKSPKMFATAVVLLPSQHTGGQLVLSHDNASQIYDFSAESFLGTSVMAWYTDVFHEVKPVTSGYRLALSFNVVRSATSSLAVPKLPDMADPGKPLRTFFRKWQAEKFDDPRDKAAYLLGHSYSKNDLLHGEECLKGKDAHLLSYVRDVAEELGFVLALANIDYTVTGPANDYGGGYSHYKRGRWYDESDDSDGGPSDVSMDRDCDVVDRKLSVSDLYDLDGNLVPGEIDIGNEDLIPENCFDGKSPDDKEYEGYQGNYAGNIDYYYHSTALLIAPEGSADFARDIRASHGLRQLAKSTTASLSTPAPADLDHARIVINNLRLANQAECLIKYALTWTNLGLWEDILRIMSSTMVTTERIFEGWRVFGWEAIKPRVGNLISVMSDVARARAILDSFPGQALNAEEAAQVEAWCKGMRKLHLTHVQSFQDTDVPYLFSAISEYGLDWFTQKFLKTLWSEKDTLQTESTKQSFDSLLTKSSTTVFAHTTHSVHEVPLLVNLINTQGSMWFETLIFPNIPKEQISLSFFLKLWEGLWALKEQRGSSEYDSLITQVVIVTLKLKCQPEQIPLLIKVIKAYGDSWFREKIFDLIPQTDDMYTFWIELAKSLRQHGVGIVSDPNSPSSPSTISKILDILVKFWEVKVAAHIPYYLQRQALPTQNPADRIIEILDLSISTGNIQLCATLLRDLMTKRQPTNDNFASFHQDLLIRMGKIRKIDIGIPPFNTFTETLIVFYLRSILGSKPAAVQVGKFGCGCANCKQVESFLTTAAETTTLSMNKAPRTHVCSHMDRRKDLVTYTVASYGRPTPVHVTKMPALLAHVKWSVNQANAKKILAGLGGEAAMNRIFGSRATDVWRVVNGTQSVASTGTSNAASTSQVQGRPQASQAQTQASLVPRGSSFAGTKRKQNPHAPKAVERGEVIDLTED